MSSSLLDEIGAQIQMERIVLVENGIRIQGGLKWTPSPLKTRVVHTL